MCFDVATISLVLLAKLKAPHKSSSSDCIFTKVPKKFQEFDKQLKYAQDN